MELYHDHNSKALICFLSIFFGFRRKILKMRKLRLFLIYFSFFKYFLICVDLAIVMVCSRLDYLPLKYTNIRFQFFWWFLNYSIIVSYFPLHSTSCGAYSIPVLATSKAIFTLLGAVRNNLVVIFSTMVAILYPFFKSWILENCLHPGHLFPYTFSCSIGSSRPYYWSFLTIRY